jgi:hypothetical protein
VNVETQGARIDDEVMGRVAGIAQSKILEAAAGLGDRIAAEGFIDLSILRSAGSSGAWVR